MNKKTSINIERINGGNQKEFKVFFDQNFLIMCQFANRFLEDLDASKDVVQEAFVNSWEKNEKYGDINHLKGYLYKSIRNKCLNIKRDSVVAERNKNEIEYLSSDLFFRNALIEEEVYSFICEKIEALPEMQRNVMKLQIEGLSNEEIAEVLNISINTVRTHKQRAKSVLKSELVQFMEVLVSLLTC